MSSLSRELVFLILQFLDEEKFKETVHKLEQESGFFFNMKYFEDQVQAGEWDEVERYLCGFTKVEDNRYSMKIFFEIRKQKYLEALDRHDRAKAVEILVKDLKVFASFNEDLFKEITHLLTLDNFRQNEQLSKYGDTKSARNIMLVELKKLIEANPLFRDKLAFPSFKTTRLRTLINQSLNWQHQLCKHPRPNPEIKTLFTDHTCAAGASNGTRAPPPTNSPLAGPVPKPGVFPPIGAHSPFQSFVAPSGSAIAGWMSNTNPSIPHAAVAAGPPPGHVQPPGAAAFLKHPRTPPGATGMDYQMADSEHLMKRFRSGQSEEVSFSGSTHPPNIYSQDDLPKAVARNLSQGSNVMSMDFHPQQQTVLLVGTNVGDISIWEVGSRNRLAHKPFKVWDISACTMPLQTTLVKDVTISVNRCIWGPDGSILDNTWKLMLILAVLMILPLRIPISNSVLSHAVMTRQLRCGDAVAGRRQYIFEGHDAPVYSVCPHYKENIQFIFSTAIDGKIKAWLYDCLGSRVDYDAPGLWCTAMAYSADGTRLFSCGTSKEGESHLVEWNESEGAIKRTYSGFRKRSLGVVQFDTTKNRFLAAGDEFQIKFWDMDNSNILTVTDADGGLPASPRLRFSKEGSLLAVTTSDNGIKILANTDGLRILRMVDSRTFEGSRGLSEAINVKQPIAGALGPITNVSAPIVPPERSDRVQPPISIGTLAGVDSSRVADMKSRISDNVDKIKSWKLPDIVDPAQLKALRLPDPLTASKVVRLLYTNSGVALLALASNAVHKLWKWQRTDRNPSMKSTASIVPQLWQPSNGALMTNDLSDAKSSEESAACIALSKNDSYVMSASGGKVSLFNMMTFKVMTTFMPPPPAATFLAFHPQDNNIIAIGMEDSSIQVYNVRVDEVKTKLNGHQKRISGLAFSQTLNVLLCVWNIDGWEKRKARPIQAPPGHTSSLVGETKVQFHNDQTHLLVVHESQIAVYDGQLECLRAWYPKDSLSADISSAIYSSDGLLVFTGFCDGAVGVFDADSLRLQCRIAPSAYITSSISSGSSNAFPMVIATHPSEPYQIALGMSDGAVHVIEPSDAEPKWGGSVPQENGASSSVPSSSALNSQPSDTPSR
ncbi:transducin family protein [Actinidia rufa]|uniref:Transducin family protein n=1 Tax=Actinidia rufa TaxID=165716 RepID=A0A7J0H0U3_9ERIC|nr:transducin family protein [Actinidia rufa]